MHGADSSRSNRGGADGRESEILSLVFFFVNETPLPLLLRV